MIDSNDVIDINLDDDSHNILTGTAGLLNTNLSQERNIINSALNAVKENPKISMGLLGATMTAASARSVYQNLPKAHSFRANIGQVLSDVSSNYLEGFYTPGANKNALYMKELTKATGRIANLFVNPQALYHYKRTGLSPFTINQLASLNKELKAIDDAYIAGEFGDGHAETQLDKAKNPKAKKDWALERAKQAKRKAMKVRHYKLTNDNINQQYMFTGKQSDILEDYRTKFGKKNTKPWYRKADGKEFIEDVNNMTGSKGKARIRHGNQLTDYITSRHTIDPHNPLRAGAPLLRKTDRGPLQFVKWTDNNITGIMRGAKMHPESYYLLQDLKQNYGLSSRATKNSVKMALDNAKIHITKLHQGGNSFAAPKIIGDRLYFTFSPTMRSNFDWGGYNVVAQWNPKNPEFVKFIGTDFRDVPKVSGMLDAKPVINYVGHRKMKIGELEKEVDLDKELSKRRRKPTPIQKIKNRVLPDIKTQDLSLLEVRKTNVASKHTHVDGAGTQFKGMKEDLDKVLATSEKQRRNLTSKQAYKIARNQLLKSRVGGAIGVGLTAYSAYESLKEIFGEPKDVKDKYF